MGYAPWVVLGGGIVVIVAWLVWAARPRRMFVIEIEEGQARCVDGEVDAAFVTDITRLCGLWSITEGRVTGYTGASGRVRLEIRGPVRSIEQAIRNTWAHPVD